jgi:hypothetical protein
MEIVPLRTVSPPYRAPAPPFTVEMDWAPKIGLHVKVDRPLLNRFSTDEADTEATIEMLRNTATSAASKDGFSGFSPQILKELGLSLRHY